MHVANAVASPLLTKKSRLTRSSWMQKTKEAVIVNKDNKQPSLTSRLILNICVSCCLFIQLLVILVGAENKTGLIRSTQEIEVRLVISASPKAIIIYTNIVKLLLRTAFKLIRMLNNIADAPRNSLVTGLFSIECTYVTYIITLLYPVISNASNKEVKEKGSVIRDSNSLEDEGHDVLDIDKTEILAALEAKIPKYMLLRKDAAAALKLCIRLAADLA
ncbi:hypothetical protein K504DRAFT_453115 [Pleomassaria siparia CBS 279.74]|uniref:Uncharacterized protein n=1 Tax=Pleomassaria siparia CBS 279.74 TaxID=1314801 RepID=A0A6G1KFK0_9PLEO|nr:hypothetical protein K504DRAFT_453115 [Pleomassaria siparia CBS 279.74]